MLLIQEILLVLCGLISAGWLLFDAYCYYKEDVTKAEARKAARVIIKVTIAVMLVIMQPLSLLGLVGGFGIGYVSIKCNWSNRAQDLVDIYALILMFICVIMF